MTTKTTALAVGADFVVLNIADPGWQVWAGADGGVTLSIPDRVGLVEQLLDALTDDERAGVRQYLGGAS